MAHAKMGQPGQHAAPLMIAHACLGPSLQVNPHKRLRHLYGGRMMAQYRGLMLGDLSPHVYAIAEQVLRLPTCLPACMAWEGRRKPTLTATAHNPAAGLHTDDDR